VLVTGTLLTSEWWGPSEETLGFGYVVISLFWGVAAALVWFLVVPTWRGARWPRAVLGGSALVGCAAARHWLSYEPEPGTASYGVGVSVAVLLGIAAAAALLAEVVTSRRPRLLTTVAVVAMLGVVAWAVGLVPAGTGRYTGDWTAPDLGGPDAPEPVTGQVLSRPGPERCGWQSSVLLTVGWPLGATPVPERPDSARVYVRDPDAVLPPGTRAAGALDTDDELPSGSLDTGYRRGELQLWLGTDGGEQYAYVVAGRDVERWPRVAEPPTCA
jgi:hypothetical protein